MAQNQLSSSSRHGTKRQYPSLTRNSSGHVHHLPSLPFDSGGESSSQIAMPSPQVATFLPIEQGVVHNLESLESFLREHLRNITALKVQPSHQLPEQMSGTTGALKREPVSQDLASQIEGSILDFLDRHATNVGKLQAALAGRNQAFEQDPQIQDDASIEPIDPSVMSHFSNLAVSSTFLASVAIAALSFGHDVFTEPGRAQSNPALAGRAYTHLFALGGLAFSMSLGVASTSGICVSYQLFRKHTGGLRSYDHTLLGWCATVCSFVHLAAMTLVAISVTHLFVFGLSAKLAAFILPASLPILLAFGMLAIIFCERTSLLEKCSRV